MRLRHKKNLTSRMERSAGVQIAVSCNDRDIRKEADGTENLDINEIFGREAPLWLEIGCGKGRFACELAKANPDKNIIAVEVQENVIVTACENCVSEGIENLKFMCIGAEYLNRFIPKGTVERIYLNFSCPYPKNHYKNHRLTAPRFLSLYRGLLCESGRIEQKTDNKAFFEYSIESISEAGYIIRNVSLDLHNSCFEGNIVTEYEEKFASLGQPIYRLEAYLK